MHTKYSSSVLLVRSLDCILTCWYDRNYIMFIWSKNYSQRCTFNDTPALYRAYIRFFSKVCFSFKTRRCISSIMLNWKQKKKLTECSPLKYSKNRRETWNIFSLRIWRYIQPNEIFQNDNDKNVTGIDVISWEKYLLFGIM